jgi:hypothetical protein
MTLRLRRMSAPTLAFSLLICVSCGSSPEEVVAIEVDNSIAIETTTGSSSTAETQSTFAETTTSLAQSDPSAPPAPITLAPPDETPATQAPVTQAPTTQAPTTQAPTPSDPVGLRIEPEYVGGYNRDLFADWYDADRNGCNTRKEVLIAESLDPVQIGSKCSISGGRWFSIYDNVETTDSSKFDIDHMVPLSEAWDSGAWNWNADQRKHFANDLDQPFFLIAVTASSNRSKSDRDPAEWMPPNASYHCTYVRIWIEIKRAWDLSVDQAEHDYLARKLASC